ncbi:MAG: HAD-IIA family hydrolase [Chloroflexia bacterium]|nr:HAD-IIA family hydrolase [Chloroflexia bacterium]
MDGVLYRGNTLIPEVKAFLCALDSAGIPYTMATNNSTNSQLDYVMKLERLGVSVPEESIFTSAVATATYLRSTYPDGTRVYVVGMKALRHAIFEDGYFFPAEADADVVVSGADFELVYGSLRTACLAIRAGADYVATNADTTFPSEAGLIPGSGAIVAALVAATDVEPTIVGKPSPVMVESCLTAMGIEASQAVMLGDRLDTDILAGQRANARTVMVLTGVHTPADVRKTGIEPDLVIDTLESLTRFHTHQASSE